MPEIKLHLKCRHPYLVGTQVNVSIDWLKSLNPGRDGQKILWDTLTEQLQKLPEVHDKQWLEVICNWSPPDGLSLVQQAPWIRLAARVSDLDDSREGNFLLGERDADIIWGRITDAQFKVRRDPAFDRFILDLLESFGRELPEEN